jgi:hypothetical protein
MADELARHRAARDELRELDRRIERCRRELDDLYRQRKEAWRALDDEGVPRSTCAKWSGVDAMVVTRALQKDEP